MGTYDVAVTRCESATLRVEAGDPVEAESVAMSDADGVWEPDTINTQVDDVREVVTS